MKVFLVERTDKIGYDEYVGFVVRAENKKEALKLCQDESDEHIYYKNTFKENNTRITELLDKGKKGIILDSYNRG